MMTLITSKVERDAGGMLNDPTRLSRTMPCSTNRDEFWAYTAKNMIVVAQIGNILIRIFSSSTWVTVQSFHGSVEALFKSVDETMAALSRNLYNER
jgi:hypothetical protein